MSQIRLAAKAANILGEVPVWDVESQSLWWIDIEGKLLQQLHHPSGVVTQWTMPERVGSFALCRTGGIICAFASGFAFYDLETGETDWIARPEADTPRNRFNDGKVDRNGRFWAGTMDDKLSERTGALYRLDPDLSVHCMETGIGISNALCWSPDNSKFYFADTMQQEIWQYDYAAETGMISQRRLFVHTRDQPGNPDGATIDSEGFLWNAQWDGWRLVRYAPDGSVDRIVELPVQKPTSVIFGGKNLETLYITTAIWDLSDAALAEQPWAGSLLAVDVGVCGLPETRFDR
ncbi:SMP-30/gluconolactonase/LRE family protein [Pararhizobium sp. IMCC21322]|uniref:SMP-30/gluconolactonase/LRE family protein n=1 Tax=Pararhizobium sp. IMCC21322 TaxID=3067903 RepID=UPI0027404D7F|nr:SMP-30/gluconolactonase/LRE family protein [Pararhizobium sp. IMCC21322]